MDRKFSIRVLDVWTRRPVSDFILAVLLAVAVFAWCPILIDDGATRNTLYTAVAAFSGIILAASTFAAGLLYNSTASLVVHVRKLYAAEIRSNWTLILVYCFTAGLASIAAFAVDQLSMHFTDALVFGSVVLLATSMSRVIFWTRFVLFSSELDTHNRIVKDIPYRDAPQ
ncbi:hypothetical protein GCM10009689_17480 [Brevibacterium antiquum]|uniref:hypothetical protein n=1 Tax=Brevibacterium antiquum TaxID=234835 RepID=UPI0018DF2188|nr:hypothetical protein [Brevibacterium antiquum]